MSSPGARKPRKPIGKRKQPKTHQGTATPYAMNSLTLKTYSKKYVLNIQNSLFDMFFLYVSYAVPMFFLYLCCTEQCPSLEGLKASGGWAGRKNLARETSGCQATTKRWRKLTTKRTTTTLKI